jgi:hypothetical protein
MLIQQLSLLNKMKGKEIIGGGVVDLSAKSRKRKAKHNLKVYKRSSRFKAIHYEYFNFKKLAQSLLHMSYGNKDIKHVSKKK